MISIAEIFNINESNILSLCCSLPFSYPCLYYYHMNSKGHMDKDSKKPSGSATGFLTGSKENVQELASYTFWVVWHALNMFRTDRPSTQHLLAIQYLFVEITPGQHTLNCKSHTTILKLGHMFPDYSGLEAFAYEYSGTPCSQAML